MIVARVEIDARDEPYREAVEHLKKLFGEGGPYHNKKGYRIYNTYWSGKAFRLAVEMTFESLAEWEAFTDEAFSSLTPVDLEQMSRSFSGYDWSYWTLEAEG